MQNSKEISYKNFILTWSVSLYYTWVSCIIFFPLPKDEDNEGPETVAGKYEADTEDYDAEEKAPEAEDFSGIEEALSEEDSDSSDSSDDDDGGNGKKGGPFCTLLQFLPAATQVYMWLFS